MNTNFHVDGRVPSNNPGISYVPTQTSVKPAEVIYHQEEPKPEPVKAPEPPTKYDYLLQMDPEAFSTLHSKMETRKEEINLSLQEKQQQVDALMQTYLRAKLQIDFNQPVSEDEQRSYVRFPELQKEMSALRTEKDELDERLKDINYVLPLLNYRKKVAELKPELLNFLELWNTNSKSKKNQLQLFAQLKSLATKGQSVRFSAIDVSNILSLNPQHFNSETKALLDQGIGSAIHQLEYLSNHLSDYAKAIESHNFGDRKSYTYQQLLDGAVVDDLLANLQKNVDNMAKYVEQENG